MFFALTLFLYASLVSAHGRVTNVTTSDGTVYAGWDPALAKGTSPIPASAAWRASNLGNIFVPPSRFNTSAISCHYNATPGALSVNLTAGGSIRFQWNEWPTSHIGPVLTYIAACNGSCTQAHAETLEWNKIDELGWLNGTGADAMDLGGTWATNVLIKNDFQWTVKIPEILKEGDYVLRHEIIALHVAEKPDGAQAYPQCVNLRLSQGKSGQATALDGGVLGSRLYGIGDKGIAVDVHKKLTGYDIPGPKLWSGAERTKQPNEKR